MTDPRDYDQSGKMGWGSKLLLIAFACAAGMMVFIIGFSFVFSRFLDRTIENYTDAGPVVPATAAASPEETEAIEQRVEDYDEALNAGEAQEPLVLSEHEVNVLLADALKDDDGTAVGVRLLPGQVQAQVSVLLTQTLPLGPWTRDLTGRYLNGTATFDAAVHNGELDLRLASFEVKGRRLPERVLAVLRNEIENAGVLDDPEVQEFIGKVDSVDVGAGQLTIIPPN
jgi:hypothetical protein